LRALLEAVRAVESGSPEVERLAQLVSDWPDHQPAADT
jgi:hypothetical protein